MADYQNAEIVPQGDEKKLLARFYKTAVENRGRSTAEGRPVFDEQVFVSIIIPGDKNTKVERKARDEDKARFPLAWQRYHNNETKAVDGTPVEEWPRVSVAQVAELKAMNIMTVEHLADLSDTICQKMMGLDQLRKEARGYIAAAKDASHAQHLACELAKRDDEIASLKGSIAELSAKLDELTPKSGKRERAAA